MPSSPSSPARRASLQNLPNDHLMRVQQHLKAVPGQPHVREGGRSDARNLGNIVRHRDADATEQLYPLGNGVDQLHLLVEVLVEEQMQLVERGPSDLPVRFLVQIAERRLCRQEVGLAARSSPAEPSLRVQAGSKWFTRSVCLNLSGMLMEPGLCGGSVRCRTFTFVLHEKESFL